VKAAVKSRRMATAAETAAAPKPPGALEPPGAAEPPKVPPSELSRSAEWVPPEHAVISSGQFRGRAYRLVEYINKYYRNAGLADLTPGGLKGAKEASVIAHGVVADEITGAVSLTIDGVSFSPKGFAQALYKAGFRGETVRLFVCQAGQCNPAGFIFAQEFANELAQLGTRTVVIATSGNTTKAAPPLAVEPKTKPPVPKGTTLGVDYRGWIPFQPNF
jgi:hypothetical protein